MFELSPEGIKKLFLGEINLNGNKYKTYDNTEHTNNDGYKDPYNFFYLDIKPGNYYIKASAGRKYFKVNTELLEFKGTAIYNFNFYFIRKDILRKGKVINDSKE